MGNHSINDPASSHDVSVDDQYADGVLANYKRQPSVRDENMEAIKNTMAMFCVSLYAATTHTNPFVSVYVRSLSNSAAIRSALDSVEALMDIKFKAFEFKRLDIEIATWKSEEELCYPSSSKTVLP
jgi:hypothetical protein